MQSEWVVGCLPAVLLFISISLAGWLYLRIRLNGRQIGNRVSEPEQTRVPRFQEITPFDIDQLDNEEWEQDSSTVVGWRPDAIMVLDHELRLNWANRTAELWFGISLSQDFGEKLDSVSDHQELIQYLGTSDHSGFFDCSVSDADEIAVRVRITPYHQNQLLVQARDISQVKALELVRRDFVSSASHELRTPVSVLYGYLEMMMQEDTKGIGNEWKSAVKQMHEQTERIKKIIEDMLLLSRLEETDSIEEHEYIEMVPILDSAFRNARVLSGDKKHQIEIDIDPDSSLLGNKEGISSLINNLVSNAVRYTPDRGAIIIKWKTDSQGGDLSVIDTGIGIAEQDIPRVTERFYRSDPARSRETGGTGLGLAIVNHIVNHHQAMLHIESILGQGSQFTVKFPLERVRKSQTQVGLLLN